MADDGTTDPAADPAAPRPTPQSSRDALSNPSESVEPPPLAPKVDLHAAPPLETAASSPGLDTEHDFTSYTWDLESDCIDWSDNASDILNVPIDAIATGRSYAKLIDGNSGKTPADLVQHVDAQDGGDGIPFSTDYSFNTNRSAQPIRLQDVGRWYRHRGNDGAGIVQGIIRRLNQTLIEEDQLQKLTKFDEVTGQLNRTHLLTALERAFDDIAVTHEPAAFMVVAIDHFDRLNEAFGFDVGDYVIGSIAKRVRAHMRRPDSIGRLSGNKLGIILGECDVRDAQVAAERFIEAVRTEVIKTPSGPVPVTISVGGILIPRHARSSQKAVAGALEALAQIQNKRYGSVNFFVPDPKAEDERVRAAQLGDEIVSALNDRRVNIALMPIAEVSDQSIAFHECLVRIVRPDGSQIPANDFIQIAERLGYIRLIDHRVLELALGALRADQSLSLSVNVSPLTAADPAYLSKVVTALQGNADMARRLVIELTETEQLKSLEDTTLFVSTLHDLGVRVAIDDFGAGYTSFRTLQSLKIDIVKIDASYVFDMVRNMEDHAFVRALSDLADTLGITVVAEGVENEVTLDAVSKLGISWVQGFGIGSAVLRQERDNSDEA